MIACIPHRRKCSEGLSVLPKVVQLAKAASDLNTRVSARPLPLLLTVLAVGREDEQQRWDRLAKTGAFGPTS